MRAELRISESNLGFTKAIGERLRERLGRYLALGKFCIPKSQIPNRLILSRKPPA